MPLDQVANFVRGTTDAAVDSTQTTISVVDASIFPDPADGEYNLVLWDDGAHPRPDQDPDVEIVRVTARDTGTNDLTVTRAQEGTAGASHPSGSALQLSPTAKVFGDIAASDQAVEDFTTAGGSGTVPTSQGDGSLLMETPAGLEAQNRLIEDDFGDGSLTSRSGQKLNLFNKFDFQSDNATIGVFRPSYDVTGGSVDSGVLTLSSDQTIATKMTPMSFRWELDVLFTGATTNTRIQSDFTYLSPGIDSNNGWAPSIRANGSDLNMNYFESGSSTTLTTNTWTGITGSVQTWFFDYNHVTGDWAYGVENDTTASGNITPVSWDQNAGIDWRFLPDGEPIEIHEIRVSRTTQ